MSDLPSNATPVTAVRESASAFNYLERQLGKLVAARSTSPESTRSGRSVRSGGGSIGSRSPSPLMAVLTAVSAVTAVPEAVAVFKEIPDVPVSIPSRPVAAPASAAAPAAVVAAEAIPVVPVSIPSRSSARPPGLSPPPLAPAPPPAPALAYMPPPPFPPLPRPQSMRQPVSLLKREEPVKPAPVPVAQLVAQPVAPPVAQPVVKAHVGPIGWATRAQALAPVKSEPLPVKQEAEPATNPLPTSPVLPSPVPSSPAPEPQPEPEPVSPATQTVPLLAPQPAPHAMPQSVDQSIERVNQVCQFVPPIVRPLLDRTAPRVSDYFQTPTGKPLDQLSVEDICTLLHRIELGQYADMFRAHKISGKFLACSDFYRDYEDLGMRTCLHGKYLLKCV